MNLYTHPMPLFRTANGKWRALRFCGCAFLLSAIGSLMTRGFYALPWVAFLLISLGSFALSVSEADTPPAKSRGLILVYVMAFIAASVGAVLLLVDLGKH